MARCWILELLALGALSATAVHATNDASNCPASGGSSLFTAPSAGWDKQGGDIPVNCGVAAGGVTPVWAYVGSCCAFNTAIDAYNYAAALCITAVTPECAGFNVYPNGGKWWSCLKDGVANQAVDPSLCFYNSTTYPAYTCPSIPNFTPSVNIDNVNADLGICQTSTDPVQLATTLATQCASTAGCVAFNLYPDDGKHPNPLGAGNWWGCLKSATSIASAGSNYLCYYTYTPGCPQGDVHNLVTNGDFSNGYTGWTVTGALTYNGNNCGLTNIGLGSTAGVQADIPNGDHVSQAITGLTVGARYKLSFKLLIFGSSNQFLVKFTAAPSNVSPASVTAGAPSAPLNDPSLMGIVNAAGQACPYKDYEYDFLATATSGTLEFRATNQPSWSHLTAISLVGPYCPDDA